MPDQEKPQALACLVAGRLYRLSQVLQFIPVSKSTWHQGQKDGRFPKGHLIGPRTRVYKGEELLPLIHGEENHE